MPKKSELDRADIYTRITDRIVEDLEKGLRPWMKPWSGANTNGRISRPLRHNGLPYSGVTEVSKPDPASNQVRLFGAIRRGRKPSQYPMMMPTGSPSSRMSGAPNFELAAKPPTRNRLGNAVAATTTIQEHP